MNIDVANMVVNLGGKTEGIDYWEAVITFSSVFLGAFLAYQCSKLLEKHQTKKQETKDYDVLSTQIAISLDNFLTYKQVYLDNVKKAFESNNIEEALKTSYIPDSYFSFNFEKYYYLTSYNRCFLPALSLLKKAGGMTLEEIQNYYKDVFNVFYLRENKGETFSREYENLKKRFLFLYNEFELLCARAYALNKVILIGYERYFNPYSYEGVVDNFDSEIKIDKRLSNKEALEFVQKQLDMFKPYWVLTPNIYCYACFFKRKIKHNIICFIQYFCKPKICKNCRCCKIKVRKSDTKKHN